MEYSQCNNFDEMSEIQRLVCRLIKKKNDEYLPYKAIQLTLNGFAVNILHSWH